MDVAGSICRSTIIVKNIYTSCSSSQMLAVMSPVVKIDAQTLRGRVLDCYAEYKIGQKYNEIAKLICGYLLTSLIHPICALG
jgi:hypothetical protein